MNIDSIISDTSTWMTSHGWRIILILVIMALVRRFGMMIISRIIHRSLKNTSKAEGKRDKKLRGDTLVSLTGSVFKIVIWASTILLILGELGLLQSLAPIFAGAGILSLVIGFGTQAFVKDFVSGMFIVSENQYRVGDIIEINGAAGVGVVEGRVTQVSMRTTTLRDYDGAIHVVPNGTIMRVANKTLDYAKVNLEITVPIESDLRATESEINKLGEEMAVNPDYSHMITQAPRYYGVRSFSQSEVVIEVRAKAVSTEQWHTSSAIKSELIELLRDNDFFKPRKETSGKSK